VGFGETAPRFRARTLSADCLKTPLVGEGVKDHCLSLAAAGDDPAGGLAAARELAAQRLTVNTPEADSCLGTRAAAVNRGWGPAWTVLHWKMRRCPPRQVWRGLF